MLILIFFGGQNFCVCVSYLCKFFQVLIIVEKIFLAKFHFLIVIGFHSGKFWILIITTFRCAKNWLCTQVLPTMHY